MRPSVVKELQIGYLALGVVVVVALLVLALVCVLASVLAGAYVERLCFAPHRRGSAIAAMVASFAIWMQLEEAAILVLPRHLYAFPALYEGGPVAFAGFTVRVEALVMLGAAALACAALWWILYRTRFGVAARFGVDRFGAPGHAERAPNFGLFPAVEHHSVVRSRRTAVFAKAVAVVTMNA